jgi:hypothetical protein
MSNSTLALISVARRRTSRSPRRQERAARGLQIRWRTRNRYAHSATHGYSVGAGAAAFADACAGRDHRTGTWLQISRPVGGLADCRQHVARTMADHSPGQPRPNQAYLETGTAGQTWKENMVNRKPVTTRDEQGRINFFRRAASKLRSRPRPTASASTQMDFRVSHLLDAISKALALRRSSVPEQVQRAALGLAQQVQEERPQPGRTGHQNGSGSWDEFQPDMGWGAVRNETVPFATSIRLGRMG